MTAPTVAITGLGVVSPFGVGADALWDGLTAGRSAVAPITRFDASRDPCPLGAQIPDGFSVRDFVPKTYRKATKVMCPDIELAVAAAMEAVRDARLVTRATAGDGRSTTYPPDRIGCQIGAGLIAADLDELAAAVVTAEQPDSGRFDHARWGDAGMHNLTPLWMLKYLPNMLACHVTIVHDAQGPSNTITCTHASSLLSIGESRSVIQRGDADACFSGGAESKLNPISHIRTALAGRLGDFAPDTPGHTAVRPYDPHASGSVLGEAGGIVLAESADAARDRGAPLYAEIVGFGAGHTPPAGSPAARALGLQVAVNAALDDAQLSADDIDAVAPTAVGVPAADHEEAAALRAVFAERLAGLPLITLTPALGDTVAAAGGLAVAAAALALAKQRLPARIHAGSTPKDLRADAAPAADATLEHVLVCSTGMGGQNAALVLRRPANP